MVERLDTKITHTTSPLIHFSQLSRVESVDRRMNLKPSPALPNAPTKVKLEYSEETPQWRTVNIFVSSTFMDMEAERRLLHMFVLPQIQRRARER